MQLIELDLSVGSTYDHPEIDPDKLYLCKIYGEYKVGTFTRYNEKCTFKVGTYTEILFINPTYSYYSKWNNIFIIPESLEEQKDRLQCATDKGKIDLRNCSGELLFRYTVNTSGELV